MVEVRWRVGYALSNDPSIYSLKRMQAEYDRSIEVSELGQIDEVMIPAGGGFHAIGSPSAMKAWVERSGSLMRPSSFKTNYSQPSMIGFLIHGKVGIYQVGAAASSIIRLAKFSPKNTKNILTGLCRLSLQAHPIGYSSGGSGEDRFFSIDMGGRTVMNWDTFKNAVYNGLNAKETAKSEKPTNMALARNQARMDKAQAQKDKEIEKDWRSAVKTAGQITF